MLCPFRVACVSRLIGNLDTTANLPGWQVHLCVLYGKSLPRRSMPFRFNAETPPQPGWRFCCPALVTGLPNMNRTMALSTVPIADFPAGFPFVGRFVGGGSCRVLLFFGLAGILPSSLHITGALLISNRRAVSDTVCFQQCTNSPTPGLSRFW